MKRIFGWKFLTPNGSTIRNGVEFFYNLPKRDEKWSDWTEHPNPAEPDGNDCGEGRLHVMKKFSARYAPDNWWPWYTECANIIGESCDKIGAAKIRLRRISKKLFFWMIRKGYMRDADMRGADIDKQYKDYISKQNVIGFDEINWIK